MQSASRDIYELIKKRNCYLLVGEVRDDSECSNRVVKDQAIELRDDVCTTLVLQYDNKQTKISHTHFAIERLLDGSISDEDKVAKFEVILDDGGGMLLFKMDHSIHIGGKCCRVRPTFLQGDGAPSNEVG